MYLNMYEQLVGVATKMHKGEKYTKKKLKF